MLNAILLAVVGSLSFHVSELSAPEARERDVLTVDVPEAKQKFGENRRWGYSHGLMPEKPVAVRAGCAYEFSFEGNVTNLACTYVLYLRMFDAAGRNVSADVAAPDRWSYSPSSKAFYVLAVKLDEPNKWQKVTRPFVVPEGVAAVLPVVATWRGEYVRCRRYAIVEKSTLVRHEVAFVREGAAASGVERYVAREDQLALAVAKTENADGSLTVRATVADIAVPPRPRALRLSAEWAHDLAGWTWHRNWRTDETIGAKSSFSDAYGVGGHAVSRFPFSAVSKDGVGFAFGTPLDAPAFESRTVTAKGIASTVPVGLLERGGKGTSATYEWLVFPFRGAWGFRSAAKAYYLSQGGKFRTPPADAAEGTWQWPVWATRLPDRPGDFGLAFWEAPATVGRKKKEIETSHAHGIGVFPYTEAWGMRQALPTLPDGGHPPVSARLAELQGWASETNAKARWFDAPRHIAAEACLNSLPVQPDGTHPFAVDKYDRWTHWWRTNSDPRLTRPNRASLCWDYTIGLDPDAIDGLYLDSVSYGFAVNFNNVRPEHLAVMDEPLVYDVETARPCANGMQHQVAFVKWVADRMHAKGKRIFGNVFEVAHRFHATTIDIYGSEVGCWGSGGAARADKLRNVLSDESCCERRFYAYRRPVGDLLQEGNFTTPAVELPAAGITNYVDHHMFYAFYPGVCTIGGEEKPGYANWKRYFGPTRQCERDRELFKRAIPLIRRMNRAGWMPETLVRSADKRLLVERYGMATGTGERFLALRNASADTVETVLSAEGECVAAFASLEPVWGGVVAKPAPGGWAVRLAPWQTVVYKGSQTSIFCTH